MNETYLINFVAPLIVARRFGVSIEEADEIVKNSLKDEYEEYWIE